MNQPPCGGILQHGPTNQAAGNQRRSLGSQVAREPAQNNTRQSQLYEKGNLDQRLAAGGMPDRDR